MSAAEPTPLVGTLRQVARLLSLPGESHRANPALLGALRRECANLADALEAVPLRDLEAAAGRYAELARDCDRVASNYEDECDPDDRHDAALLAEVPTLRDQAERQRRLAHALVLIAGGEP